MAKYIIGVDEVGRGALAGPVCSVAVAIKVNEIIPFKINDSKKLSKKRIETLAPLIMQRYRYGIGFVSPQTIDKINILQATLLSMQLAVKRLQINHYDSINILVDGNKLPSFDHPAQCIVKGDQQEESIMLASILAKYIRDSYMQRMHHFYSMYNFTQHVGYPTTAHKDAIKKHGYSPIHRLSFQLKR
ncbi:ribonuclease HII [Entomospira culicis]|uniref:ribonuclease HII n=1 Tax=Entomospira culicis TaxID=2719989 RepID=UPI001BAEF66A|nr:ribonuclease HII [Entomospira culicis]WDI36950.1 ribonuclease HII [Entomospira culicis]WDI38579.1 ribonuclease HII [Entomospira culicis]